MDYVEIVVTKSIENTLYCILKKQWNKRMRTFITEGPFLIHNSECVF